MTLQTDVTASLAAVDVSSQHKKLNESNLFCPC
jgi:hypothetical protein